jgi:hypothetical protein
VSIGFGLERLGLLTLRFPRLVALLVLAFTVLCGTANSLELLVIYRVLQGAFGAPLNPLANALVLDAYPREQHNTANSIYGTGVVIGPMLGPILGGHIAVDRSEVDPFHRARAVGHDSGPAGHGSDRAGRGRLDRPRAASGPGGDREGGEAAGAVGDDLDARDQALVDHDVDVRQCPLGQVSAIPVQEKGIWLGEIAVEQALAE